MGAERGCGHHRGLTRPYCWLHGWRSLRRGRASSGQPDADHRRGNIARLSDLWRCAACGRGVPKRLRNRGAGRRARSRLLRFGAGARVPMAGLGGSPVTLRRFRDAICGCTSTFRHRAPGGACHDRSEWSSPRLPAPIVALLNLRSGRPQSAGRHAYAGHGGSATVPNHGGRKTLHG